MRIYIIKGDEMHKLNISLAILLAIYDIRMAIESRKRHTKGLF